MHSRTPQADRAFESHNSDESAAQTAKRTAEHNWNVTQATLAPFLLLVVVIALSRLLQGGATSHR
jgi:hypothetical protein